MGEIWINGIWTSLWLHFFVLYRKLSLFRLFFCDHWDWSISNYSVPTHPIILWPIHLSTQLFLSYVWQASLCLALWRPSTECCLLPAVQWNWSRLWECICPFIKNLTAFPQKQASSLAQENRKRVWDKETIVIKWIKADFQYGVFRISFLDKDKYTGIL